MYSTALELHDLVAWLSSFKINTNLSVARKKLMSVYMHRLDVIQHHYLSQIWNKIGSKTWKAPNSSCRCIDP